MTETLPPEETPDVEEQSGIPTDLSIQEVRRQLVSIYVVGSKSDAKALFSAVQGATEAGWTNMERILDPVWRFVQFGDLPYSSIYTGEYAGIGAQRGEDSDVINTYQAEEQARLAQESGQPQVVSGQMSPTYASTETPENDALLQTQDASGNPVTETLPQGQPTNTAVENQAQQPSSETQTQTTESGTGTLSSSSSAAELIAAANEATTDEELDEILSYANGRVTVEDAVETRREALTAPSPG